MSLSPASAREVLLAANAPSPGSAAGMLSTGSRFQDRKSTRLNSSHGYISNAAFCLKKKKKLHEHQVFEQMILHSVTHNPGGFHLQYNNSEDDSLSWLRIYQRCYAAHLFLMCTATS